jgi:acyl-CoA synthetase (NDP forming)
MNENINALFYPNSIAVVGVSLDHHKLSTIFYNNLIDGGFKGKVYPVNPKYSEFYGTACYPNVLAIPEQVDQVAVLIPANFVLDIVKECAQKGVKAVLIISDSTLVFPVPAPASIRRGPAMVSTASF